MYEYLPCREYFDRAQALFKKLGIDPSSSSIIDPELLLKRLGIPVIPEPFPRDIKKKMMACLVKDCRDGKYSILIDQEHYCNPRRSMFTLGEELGHYILHRKFYSSVNTKADLIATSLEDQYYRNREQQAKQFSSQILLPSQGFLKFLSEYRDEKGITKIENGDGVDEDLAYELAYDIGSHPDIGISESVVQIALLRWPDRPIKEFLIEEKKPSNLYGGFDDF